MDMWDQMLWPEISILEKMLRPLAVYFFLLVGLRLAGKREMAQLNTMDLIVILTLSNTVQNAIIGEDNSVTGGIIGAATLLLVNYVVVRFLYRHQGLERVLEVNPDVLVDGGRVREDRLAQEAITRSQLEMAAHKQGFVSLGDVDRAILEPGGAITFVGKRSQPEEARHRELLDRIDTLEQRLAGMLARGGPLGATGQGQ